MKTSTEDQLRRIIDYPREMTDDIHSRIELAEHLHDRINPGDLSVAEIICALMMADYDPRREIELALSDAEKRGREETEHVTGIKKAKPVPVGAGGIG